MKVYLNNEINNKIAITDYIRRAAFDVEGTIDPNILYVITLDNNDANVNVFDQMVQYVGQTITQVTILDDEDNILYNYNITYGNITECSEMVESAVGCTTRLAITAYKTNLTE